MEIRKNMEENFLTAKCTNCGALLEEGWKYCPYCTHKSETERCLFCSEEISPSWRYCPYCKKELKSTKVSDREFDDNNEWLREMLRQK